MRKRADVKIKNPVPKRHPFAQFLEYDRMILKFNAYWDDRTEFGDVRKLEVCYYLSDDTIDIKEILPRNAGRDGPSTFLKRSKLPRVRNLFEITLNLYNNLLTIIIFIGIYKYTFAWRTDTSVFIECFGYEYEKCTLCNGSIRCWTQRNCLLQG